MSSFRRTLNIFMRGRSSTKRVIKQAYRMEESFRRAKSECGLADYQVRNWIGWHHHVAQSLLTLWFLTVELLNQKKAHR